jgi:hypothetical protein
MKLWLTGMTNAGNGDHLKDLIEPIKEYFDGFVWVFHDNELDQAANYVKDEGFNYLVGLKNSKVILSPWCNRFDFSRNIGLYQGPIKYGDWFLVIDTMEIMHVDFALQIRDLIERFDKNGINGVYCRNKHLLFKYNENTSFVHNPHCGVKGVSKSIEISSLPFWKEEYWQNVRSLHRDKYEFIDHNLKYYLFPNTNHLVLKCESDQQFIVRRYMIRSEFFNELNKLNIDIQDFKSVRDYIAFGEFNETTKQCIQEEKYLNDVYRFYHLGDTSINEDFDFDNLVKVK